jgi:uncharacterized protein YcnI
VVAGILGLAAPVFAHVEFQPATADAGSTGSFTLFVEDEEPTAGTSQVRLAFPSDVQITLVELPAVPGWTATVSGGSVGGPVSEITWEGGPEPGDVTFPLTLGPLPPEAVRLQFKVIQTYDDGTEAAWIDDWPAGEAEPPTPGAVIDIVGSAPTNSSSTTSTTSSVTSTTEPSPSNESASATEDSDDSSPAGWIVLAIAAIVVVGGGAYFIVRSRSS